MLVPKWSQTKILHSILLSLTGHCVWLLFVSQFDTFRDKDCKPRNLYRGNHKDCLKKNLIKSADSTYSYSGSHISLIILKFCCSMLEGEVIHNMQFDQ